jgi:hypothetical protein
VQVRREAQGVGLPRHDRHLPPFPFSLSTGITFDLFRKPFVDVWIESSIHPFIAAT